MKKIALLTDGWRRYMTYSWVDGVLSSAREMGIDISLFTYNTNGNLSHDSKYNHGEYSLYEIPDYESFDGIIFDGTNTTDKHQIDYLVNKLKETNVPVVSIAYYVEGFHYVGNDNKSLFRAMVDHLFMVHGCRKLVFAGGPDYNYENKQRLAAFIEAHEKMNLPVTDDMILMGDYDYDTGVRYMREWMESGKDLPDAFVCANDNIAAGMCFGAEQYGLDVPGDFRITGFDNLDKAAYYKPQITTVEHNRGNIGRKALQILTDIWDGREVEAFTYLSSEMIVAESCGCQNNGRADYRMYAKWQIDGSVQRDRQEETELELDSRIAECNNYDTLFEDFAKYIEALNCSGIYICVNRKLLEAKHDCVLADDGKLKENIAVVYASENGQRIYGLHTHKDLDDYLNKSESISSYVYFPLHFRNIPVGYTVLKEPVFLFDSPFFHDIHRTFADKLQALYRQLQLANTAEVLRDIYNRDALTHLYNRIAYNEMITPRFRQYCEDKIACAMSFFDVDHFKQINDTYGHAYGDKVLVVIAGVLTQCKPKDGTVYRFGGDEFVVFFPYADESKIERFTKRVYDRLEQMNIEVSNGVIVSDPESDMELDDYLVMADKKMYEVKSGRHLKSKWFGGQPKHKLPDIDTIDNAAQAPVFYKGVDVSSLIEKEDRGVIYKNSDGTDTEVFALLKENGVNSVRVRIWNEPQNVPEAKGYCDLEHTLRIAEKIRDNDMHFMLDFHYSDYWADPGQQRKPAAWEKLDYEELKKAVYEYTTKVLTELAKIDAIPDIVQVGNEIRSGMLFPDGEVPNFEGLAGLVNAGIDAVRDFSPEIKVMIHLDQGGRFYYLKDWFDAMFRAGMKPIDAIGISFYSFWHGTFMDLRDSMTQLIARYKLPVYVVETAHPWRQCDGEHVSKELMKTAGLPAGTEEQRKSLELIMQIASSVSDNRETGVYYWEPLGVTNEDYGSWDQNMGMLDDDRKVLPGFAAFKDFVPGQVNLNELNKYMESLYEVDETNALPAGTNLVSNGDFENGTDSWWIEKSEEATFRTEDHEIYVESDANFEFKVFKEIRLEKAGRYILSADYRGTNTTGVHVELFCKSISCNGESETTCTIYPSDVRFVTYSIDDLELAAGSVQIGIRIAAPPVFGRITNIRLIRADE